MTDGNISIRLVARKHGEHFEAWLVVDGQVHVFPNRLVFDELAEASREGWTSFQLVLTKLGEGHMGHADITGDVEPELQTRIESSFPTR